MPVSRGLTGSLEPPQRLLMEGRHSSRLPRYREAESVPYPFILDTHFGVRQLRDDDAWDPLDRQAEVGISFQVPVLLDDPLVAEDRRVGLLGALAYDLGLRYAFDQSSGVEGGDSVQDISARTFDLHAGLLLSPFQTQARIRPYLGGGLAFVYTDTDLQIGDTLRSDRDSIIATYMRAGALVSLQSGRHVGLDVRWLGGSDANIDGINADVGGLSVALVFGARF